MRPVLLLFATLLSIQSYTQIPDYFDNDPVWRISEDEQLGGACYRHAQKQIYLSGDSLLPNDLTYHILRENVDYMDLEYGPSYNCDDFGYYEAFYSLLRQEGAALYRWNELSQADELVIRFDYTVGDTIQEGIYYDPGTYPVVTYIDSIETANGWLRYFELTDPVFLEPISWLLEGVGHEYGLIEPAYITVNVSSTFDCYRLNGDVTFGNELCSVISTVEEELKERVRLFPNPAEDFIRVELPADLEFDLIELQIIDMSGRVISAESESALSNNFLLNTAQLESGLHVISFTAEGVEVRKRFLKL